MENLFYILEDVSCGGGQLTFDSVLPTSVSTLISIMKVVIPIMVVFFGLLDLGKAVMSQKEDDIKKNQGLLIKRCIIAVLVFFVVSLVQFLVSLVGGNKTENNPFWDCFDCFVNNNCGH